MVHDTLLALLDENDNDDRHNILTQLQKVTNEIHSSTSVIRCVKFINENELQQFVLILSSALGPKIVPLVHNLSHVRAIYVLSKTKKKKKMKKDRFDEWVEPWSKVKGAYKDIHSLCEALNQLQNEALNKPRNEALSQPHNEELNQPQKEPLSQPQDEALNQPHNEASNQPHNEVLSQPHNEELNQPQKEPLSQPHNDLLPKFIPMCFFAQNSDMTEQRLSFLLKEILLAIDYEEWHRKNFLHHCRRTLTRDSVELKNIEQFISDYHAHKPLWWYTSQDFLHTMLNRAFDVRDMDTILLLGFFIRDLYDQIVQLYFDQIGKSGHASTRTAYLGHGLSKTDFQSFRQAEHGFVLFPNFLITNVHRSPALEFVRQRLSNTDLVGILFVITINSTFLSVDTPDGKNVLISIDSFFYVDQIQPIDEHDRLWQVNLIMTLKKKDLHAPISALNLKEVVSTDRLDIQRLRPLLSELIRTERGQHVFDSFFEKVFTERDQANLYRQLALIRASERDYVEAVRLYEKSMKIFKKSLPAKHDWLTTLNEEFALLRQRMNEHTPAASPDNKKLEMKEPDHVVKHSDSVNHHDDLRVNCSRAAKYFEQALNNLEKQTSLVYSILALTYYNTGWMYEQINKYNKALRYYEKALNVLQNHLSDDQQKLIVSYYSVGHMYEQIGNRTKADKHYRKFTEILETARLAHLSTSIEPSQTTTPVEESISQSTDAPVPQEKALELETTIHPSEPFEKAPEETKPIVAPDTPMDDQRSITSLMDTGAVFALMGEYSKALASYEKAVQIQERLLPSNHLDFALSYIQIAEIYDKMNEYSQSSTYFCQALDIFQENAPVGDDKLILFFTKCSLLYEHISDFETALICYSQLLVLHLAMDPLENLKLIVMYDNIARMCEKLGQFLEAFSVCEKVLEILQTTIPLDRRDLITYYSRMGTVLTVLGGYHKALVLHEKVLQIRRKLLPSNDPQLAVSYNDIASIYYHIGDYPKALSLHKDAMALNQKILPADHPELATSYNNIGIVYEKMGKYEQALSNCRKAIDMYHNVLPADHLALATVYSNIALLHAKMAEYSEAHSFYERAINIREKLLPPSHLDLANSYTGMGCVLAGMERYEEALRSHEKALKIVESAVPLDHPYLASTYNNIGVVYKKMGEFTQALSYYEKDLQISQAHLPANHPDLAVTYNNIGGVYYQMKNWPEALAHHQKALEIRQRALHPKHYDLSQSYHNLGLVNAAMNNSRKAASFFKNAWDIAQRSLPDNHPDLQIYRESTKKTNPKKVSSKR